MDEDDVRIRKYWLGSIAAILLVIFGVYGSLYAAGQANLPRLSFSLSDQNGDIYNSADHQNHKLVFFGFTQCSDVCPTGLSTMNSALMKMEAGQLVQPIFITVDVQRDQPEDLGAYIENFPVSFIGLSGDPAKLQTVYEKFKVYAKKLEPPDQEYVIDHSSHIYLLDKDDILLDAFDYRAKPDNLAKAIESYVSAGI